MRVDHPLYTAAQVRALDRTAIDEFDIAGYTLMCRAGAECFRLLKVHWPEAQQIGVICGPGNNGGDGLVLARLAHEVGLDVQVLMVGSPNDLSGDAAQAATDWLAAGGIITPWVVDGFEDPDVIIDALLGSGLNRAVEGSMLEAVQTINSQQTPVLAVDVPSGICADSGAVLGEAVRATITVSFIGRKRGLYTGAALDHCGLLLFDELKVPSGTYRQTAPAAQLLPARATCRQLPARRRDSHKGVFGAVLVVGGDHHMAGAVSLTGMAALRSGSGLVKVATRPEHNQLINQAAQELMCHGVDQMPALSVLIDWADVVALGPGLGLGDWSTQLFMTAVDSAGPLVVDADGLNLLAAHSVERDNWILTPHPGEAAKLLGRSTQQVQADRFTAALDIASRYNAVCVLKGAGTVIANPTGRLRVIDGGNPGMASAGMGDALTGIIASLLGQGLSRDTAADLGCAAHAYAGDLAARKGERGIIASDLIEFLPQVLG